MTNESHKPLVLVIDDNEMNLKLMEGVISYAGYRLEKAQSAEEGLARAAEIKADIVLMDIQLPGMDGYEATQVLRENADYKTTPILAISGYAMDKNKEKLIRAGFNDYIQKPIEVQNVLTTLKKYLENVTDA